MLSPMIEGFSLTLMVGIVVGTLSSIFVASPILLWFKFSVLNYRQKELEKVKKAQEKAKTRQMYEKGSV